MFNSAKVFNECKITISNKDGIITREEVFVNTTCDAWRTSIASRIVNHLETPKLWVAQYIAVWTASIPATEADVKLGTEIARQAVLTASNYSNATTAYVYARFPIWVTYNLYEAGLFLDSSATSLADTGSLLCHSVFPTVVTKSDQEYLTIQWDVNIINS